MRGRGGNGAVALRFIDGSVVQERGRRLGPPVKQDVMRNDGKL